ncbi:MAG: Mrp/NBP35 family ATP-binding protein [Hyphomicrobiaceae bacterium]|nr:Mrp/NBP35 family ATP-binding protein [Hyphomicrobiaceae bacterium]
MANQELAQSVKAALKSVEIPGGGNLADYPGLSEVIVTPSALAFAISVEPGMEGAFGPARVAATEAAQRVAEGRKVLVSITADRAPGGGQQQAVPQTRQAPPAKQAVKTVRNIIAVASGKGGVGKSTCSVNLALALAKRGLKTGVLDADIYGPSVPRLLGIEGRPAIREDEMFEPYEAFGIRAMSIGTMVQGDQSVAWRGPMASSALRQLLLETNWGGLDVLVVDMPPGTGDIQITLGQQIDLAGAVIVSTPQDLSLIDARKAIDMFKRMNIPILGMIENMSYFIAPDTGNRYDIFGHGGARDDAARGGIPFLGEVPIHGSIREQSDRGEPVVASMPGSPEAQAFMEIADRLLAKTRFS